ncbi:MAG: SCO family protein, partial [Chitinophagaceae bacterium]
MTSKSSIRLFVLLVLVIPVIIYGLLNIYENNVARLPVMGPSALVSGERIEHYISDFKLVNQDGQIRGTGEWRDKIIVADFFFSHCSSICPKMTANLMKVD